MTDFKKHVEDIGKPIEGYPKPTETYDFQASIWKGAIKQAMADAFEKSHERLVKIVQFKKKHEGYLH